MADREKNYKVGWVIPNQLGGVTHFHDDVTMEDVEGVISEAEALIKGVEGDFHILIDNRLVSNTQETRLEEMKQYAPYMSNPHLRWVVVVLPELAAIDPDTLPVEKHENTQLKHVGTIEEAID